MTTDAETLRQAEARIAELELNLILLRDDVQEDGIVTADELTQLGRIATKIEDAKQQLALKRAEYLSLPLSDRAKDLHLNLQAKIAETSDDQYFDTLPRKLELETKLASIGKLIAEEDWQTAETIAQNALTEFDDYAELAREQAAVHAKITDRLDPLRKVVSGLEGTNASILVEAEEHLSVCENALAHKVSLLEGRPSGSASLRSLKDIAVEAQHLSAITLRLGKATLSSIDDESLAIVQEMKQDGTLDQLPTEMRTTLVDHLMRGAPTEEEHEAIQDLFRIKHIDRRFQELDRQIHDSISKAYANDPDVQEMAKNWPSMSKKDKIASMSKLLDAPCGPDGWDVGRPQKITYFDKEDGSLGKYGSDKLQMNTHESAIAEFDEVLNTITHEMGHRYQAQLIDRLDLTHADPLVPGDPEYEQARWLQQGNDYFQRFGTDADDDDPFEKIYSTSPSETHSRGAADYVEQNVEDAFDLPETEDAEHSH